MPFFYQRSGKLVAAGVALVTLAGYLATLAPTVTLEHSGALAVAGSYYGIGRVPGYIVWHLLANLFTRIFSAIHCCGCGNPAWALNFMSALFGSLCCGMVALLVHRIARSALGGMASLATVIPSAAAGWLFAFSHTMWSQAVIAETHTLTCFFILLLMAMFFRWMNRPARGMALWIGLVLGVALSQSQMVALLLPVFLLAMLLTDWKLCVALIGGIGLFAVLALVVWKTVPDGHWMVAGICALALLVLVPFRCGSRGATAAGMILLCLCGLALHVYLPVASAGNPPMNWGYPQTWEGFKHVVSRGQYEKIVLADILGHPAFFARQLGLYVKMLSEQYTGPIALLGLIPVAGFRRFKGEAGKMWTVFCLAFLMYSVIALIGMNPQLDLQTVFIAHRSFIPSFALYAVFIGCGVMMVMERLVGSNTSS